MPDSLSRPPIANRQLTPELDFAEMAAEQRRCTRICKTAYYPATKGIIERFRHQQKTSPTTRVILKAGQTISLWSFWAFVPLSSQTLTVLQLNWRSATLPDFPMI
ncbi:unnamed protein product [Schistocephalus solidus]|uniref:Transposase n=1 Tax=Schistocephalus solidus TaxID=70667 RepID=A0A183SGU7_SCHSO|nr:unnamed protein product [Schistocephalus solidus]